jgi:two-component system CheB/CheR fusion protein
LRKAKAIPGEVTFNPQFPVVGIGASAGGLEAIKLFLQALPAKSGMAYIFVQHLSATHVSVLPEILEKLSPIPVVTITNGLKVEADHFYISPENVQVKVSVGTMQLEPLDQKPKKTNTAYPGWFCKPGRL